MTHGGWSSSGASGWTEASDADSWGSQPPQYFFGGPPQFAQPQQPSAPQHQHPVPLQHQPTEPKRRGIAGIVAAVAVTALVVGGAAGAGGVWLGSRSIQPPTSSAPIESGPGGRGEPVSAEGIPQIATDVLPSTVTIVVDGGRGGTGSGFVLDDQGHVATNNHVVEAASDGQVDLMFPDGTIHSATVVGRSPSYDVAVVKSDDPIEAPPVEMGDSGAVQIGEPTVAIGSPLGLGGTVTSGIVSATERPLDVGGGSDADSPTAYINGIQTDAAINPGNSGGPLVNGAGQVIGINSAILTMGAGGQGSQSGSIGVGFAIPINQARDVMDEILNTGSATYPVIGATVAADGAGVRIVEVTPGSPADRAGISSGDTVESVDGHRVMSVTDFIVRIRTHRPGDVTRLSLVGDGDVEVTLEGKVG
ncbi:S1C family serine protease [Propioniferax innocua]|uniref:Putative serine protease PepD n=1 Tax=Propioniferax innocua TaxID=1753 RepID=A0A542ZRC3_9ACTN|nr:trypsin-like peptidase domain-containing protein [Propioniferax innocua]TQL62912.1 putative serine protease PepD [Propioniferax innocua]